MSAKNVGHNVSYYTVRGAQIVSDAVCDSAEYVGSGFSGFWTGLREGWNAATKTEEPKASPSDAPQLTR